MLGIVCLLVLGNLGWDKYIIENDYAQSWTGVSMDTAHVNSDTLMDVLITGSTAVDTKHPVFWYRMDGLALFTQFTVATGQGDPDGIAGADVTGDGLTDMIVACGNTGPLGVAYYPNLGGSFGGAITIMPSGKNYAMNRSMHSCGNIGQDGDIDVCGGSSIAYSQWWTENDGSGNFTSHTIGSQPCGQYFMDVDVDGWLDLVYLNSGNTYWLRDITGNGSFAPPESIFPFSTIEYDLDLDGDEDLLRFSPNFAFSLNNGALNFSPFVLIDTRQTSTRRLDAADLDCDGDIDIAYGANDTIFIAFDTVSLPLPHIPSYEIVVLDTFAKVNVVSIANMDGDKSSGYGVNDVIATNAKTAVWWKGECEGTSIEEREFRVESLELRVFPNPSFGNAVIKYGLQEKASISLGLYDISGRLVKSLYSGTQEKGYHTINVGARSIVPLPAGIYFIRFEAGNFRATKKLTILR